MKDKQKKITDKMRMDYISNWWGGPWALKGFRDNTVNYFINGKKFTTLRDTVDYAIVNKLDNYGGHNGK